MQYAQHTPTAPPLACRGETRENNGRDAAVDEQLDQGQGGNRLVCAACGQEVTTTGARTERCGSHCHVFCNPAGFVYEIGCFSIAPGCVPLGPSSAEFTWFPGHVWQVGACSSCAAQLGWKFLAQDGPGFFGLILERLSEEESPRS